MDVYVLGMIDETDLLKGAEVYHRNERNGAPLLLLEGGVAAKIFPKKSYFQHIFRVATKTTKAHKQWKAAQALLKMGLRTPKPIAVEVFNGRGDYEASFMYAFLGAAVPMHEALLSGDRNALLAKLAGELTVMYKASILFIDFHLGNVLVDGDGELWWIDPEFAYSKAKVESNFWSRMERMHTKCDPGVLSAVEWEYFKQQLEKSIG